MSVVDNVLTDPIGRFAIAATLFIFTTFYIIRWLSIEYDKLGTYHVLKRTIRKWEENEDERLQEFAEHGEENPLSEDDGESILTKLRLVSRSYFWTLVISGGIILTYSTNVNSRFLQKASTLFNIESSLETFVGIAFMVLLLNGIMRVAAFAKLGRENTCNVERMNSWIMGFGFSFNFTLFFTFFLGLVLRIINYDITARIDGKEVEIISTITALVIVLLGVILIAIATELILYKAAVHDELKSIPEME
jgi:hypothetical protein